MLSVALLGFLPTEGKTEPITCPSGEQRLSLDVKKLTLQYETEGWVGTFNSLGALVGTKVERTAIRLQEAAEATQQWNEMLKGLAEGYNKCVLTKDQYAEGLKRIYPRLKEDTLALDSLRVELVAGRKINETKLKLILDNYFKNIKRFSTLSGNEDILERITAVGDRLKDTVTENTQILLAEQQSLGQQLANIERILRQAPIPGPEEVGSKIKKRILARAWEAEEAYTKGYGLFMRYKFIKALPYLKEATEIIPLPEFFLALGHSWYFISNFPKAEQAYRDGLEVAKRESDHEMLALLNGRMGLVLKDQGDLTALDFAKHALAIDEANFGPRDFRVAATLNIIGQILKDQGDLVGAMDYYQRGMAIDRTVFGPVSPIVATDLNNIGQILKDQGDLAGALKYTQRALAIVRASFGPKHFKLAREAIYLNNIGLVLKDQGDLAGALDNSQQALAIEEAMFGLEHPTVANNFNNIGQILQDQGDLVGALDYTKRALAIDEAVFGPEHRQVALDLNNIGMILKDQGDLAGALKYTQRSLAIAEAVLGAEHHEVALKLNNIGQILQDQGKLEEALDLAKRALAIEETVFGSESPQVAIVLNNIGQLLQGQGDMTKALNYTRRALAIEQAIFGSESPQVAVILNNMGQLLHGQGDLAGAVEYTNRALIIYKNTYGPSHSKTISTSLNLEVIKFEINQSNK